MKTQRNCPNCGAPYDINECKCPYCGTAYFDMSMIDFDSHEPFYLRIKTNGNLITQLVRPSGGITINDNCCYADTRTGLEKGLTLLNREVETNISFISVPDRGGHMYKVQHYD